MKRILMDTVGFLALWNSKDPWHDAAQNVFSNLTRQGVDFATTSLIMLECANAAARTRFRNDVVEIRRQFSIDGKLEYPTEAEMDAAWEAYARGEATEAGLVDHTSFIIMRRLGITDVFTNDRHFRAAGFHTLF